MLRENELGNKTELSATATFTFMNGFTNFNYYISVQNVITKTNGTQSTNSTESLNAQRNESKPSQSKIEATKVSVNEKGQNEISNDSNEV